MDTEASLYGILTCPYQDKKRLIIVTESYTGPGDCEEENADAAGRRLWYQHRRLYRAE